MTTTATTNVADSAANTGAHRAGAGRRTVLVAMTYWLGYLIAYFMLHLNSVSLDLATDTPDAGSMEVYWAGAGQGFAEARSLVLPLTAGSNQFRIRIGHGRGIDRIRLDPGPRQRTVRIHDIEFYRAGYWPIAFDRPGRLATIHVDRGVGTLDIGNRGIVARISGQDPQIVVPVPARPIEAARSRELGLLLLALVIALAFAWAAAGLRQRRPVVSGVIPILSWTAALLHLVTPTSVLLRSSWLENVTLSVIAAVCAGSLASVACTIVAARPPWLTRPQVIPVGVFLSLVFYLAWLALVTPSGTFRARDAERFTDVFEQAFERRFGHRSEFIDFNARTKIFGFGFSPTEKALVGKNGFFFEGYGERKVEGDMVRSFDNVSDYLGLIPFSEAELEQWRITLEERHAWLARRGIAYVFAMAPTKGLIYPEQLPDRIQQARARLGAESRFDQLARYLREHARVPVVDLKSALLSVKNERADPLLYYKTDFHWNFYGALRAYQAIMEETARAYPQLTQPVLRLADFDMEVDTEWVHHRFMGMLGLRPGRYRGEHYIRLRPKPGTAIDSVIGLPDEGVSDIYRPLRTIRGAQGLSVDLDVIENPRGEIGTVLVLGDSFVEKLLYFIAAHGRQTLYLRAVLDFPTHLYEIVQPDLVIQEIVNMYLLQEPPVNPPLLRHAKAQ